VDPVQQFVEMYSVNLGKIAPLALMIVGHARRNVEIMYVNLMKIVYLALLIVVLVAITLQRPIVVMANVMSQLKTVPIAPVIVGHVLYVEMVVVMVMRIVHPVLQIVM
jgi:hypothetical protein